MRIRLAVLGMSMLVVAGCGAAAVPGTPGTGSTTAGSITAGSTTAGSTTAGPTTGSVSTPAPTSTLSLPTTSSPSSTSITDSGSDHDLGAGVGWHGDDQTQIYPFTAGGSDCRLQTARIIRGEYIVNFQLPTTACVKEFGTHPIINGFHGLYLAVPKSAAVTRTGDMPAGTMVQFSQPYSEYTNSRNDFVDQVGLITLKEPLPDGAPVIMIVVTSRTDNPAAADLVYQTAASLFVP